MKTLLIALLIPFALMAAQPLNKKLTLQRSTKADDDAKKLQKQSREAESPVPKSAGINVACTDAGGITHQNGDPGWQKCSDALPNGAMNGSARKYDGPTKNINPNTGSPQTGESLPSVQIKK